MGSSNIKFHINNSCSPGKNMTLSASSLDKGHWNISPQTSIAAGGIAYCEAHNDGGKTKGHLEYTLSDNTTVFTIDFDIPHSGDNTGSGTLGSNPGNPNNYIVEETDSTYENTISFPKHGMPDTYWLIKSE